MILFVIYVIVPLIRLAIIVAAYTLYFLFLILKGAFLTTVWLIGLPFRIAIKRHHMKQLQEKRVAEIQYSRRIANYESQLWDHLRSK
jgi:hypothetical protein